jgi:prophage regulatory protein
MQPQTPTRQALRVNSVVSRTGISKTHLYRLVKDGKFPAPIKLSEHVSAWDAELVDNWLKAKFEGVQS